MSSRIKGVLSSEIEQLAWMDDKTKLAAKAKVSKMSQLIGYPSWITNSTALSQFYLGVSIPRHCNCII